MVLYLLRAKARSQQNDHAGAIEDIALVQQSEQAEVLADVIQDFLSGEINCENLFDHKDQE